MTAFLTFFINAAILTGWVFLCFKFDPKLMASWHLYIWTSFFAAFSILDFFHWKLVDSAKSLNQGLGSSERNNIEAKIQITNLKKQLRKVWHAGWIFKLGLVLSAGIYQFVFTSVWQVRCGALGLSYGLVLAFVNLSVFLWIYYRHFDELYDQFQGNLEKRKFKERALGQLLNNNKSVE